MITTSTTVVAQDIGYQLKSFSYSQPGLSIRNFLTFGASGLACATMPSVDVLRVRVDDVEYCHDVGDINLGEWLDLDQNLRGGDSGENRIA